MSEATLAARLRPAVGALGRAVDRVTAHVVIALATIVALQIVLAVGLFFSVEHNGRLTYQGGDQLWLVTSGWLLGQGVIPFALVGYGWPLVLAPLTWITGPSFVALLPLTTVLQVAVLGPIATLAVYDIGARIAGRAAGLWCAAAWVSAPFLATPLFVERYRELWTDQILVQIVGLTQLADYPSTVLVLVAAALVLRSLDEGALREAVLAGGLVAVAVGVKPANLLFLVGPAAAYVLARHWRAAVAFALPLAPALLALAIWKQRGLGTLPLFSLDEVRVAGRIGLDVLPLGESYWDRIGLSLDDWQRNMSNLREFFWSARLAQWAPLAGALAVARRSLPAAGLLLGWALGYIVLKGASDVASIENGSFWRLVMPALPAYVMLVAAVPLLVPTLPRRLGRRIAPSPVTRRPGRRTVVGVVGAVSVVPLVVLALATPASGPGEAISIGNTLVPVDDGIVSLTVTRDGQAQRLTWTDATPHTRTFYRVFRTQGAGPDTSCTSDGADRCELTMITLATTRERSYVDRSPEAGVTYRIGVAANWLDDPEQGDVLALSPPVHAAS